MYMESCWGGARALGSVRVFSGEFATVLSQRANVGWADLATAMETRTIFVYTIAGNAHHNGDTAAKHLALDHVYTGCWPLTGKGP